MNQPLMVVNANRCPIFAANRIKHLIIMQYMSLAAGTANMYKPAASIVKV